MDIFVARQPIFDSRMNIYGYELLFRSGVEDAMNFTNGDEATSSVITRAFIDFGIDNLVENNKVFINFTENLLLMEVASLFPREKLNIEVLESVRSTDEVIKSIIRLKKRGYTIALDDFQYKDLETPLIKYTDIIKVDFLLTTPEEQENIVKKLSNGKIKFLAEKVETKEEYLNAKKWGYSYFQGYFFSKPELKKSKNINANKLTQLQLLKEINAIDIDIDKIESIIKQDISITVKLLRYMNSSVFGFNRTINSIRHALVLLGKVEAQKWISIIALNNINGEKPKELSRLALKRAKFLELITKEIKSDNQNEMFILGMFSLLDSMLETDMNKIIDEFPFSKSLKDALTGDINSFYGKLLLLVKYFEKGNWEKLTDISKDLHLNDEDLSSKYIESESWSDIVINNSFV
ncbi:MAG: hypothetical protein CR982_08805 [Candidatus Cloacimonadota bacterium]|nr:MAG: hypothetical protein CR982_08805 [Candidatus Cloacimonadota bacterium]PIE77733.1 MAG: hypothetical protein CSA15_11460 [Candidatus Delongbacteria bacterium]